jgi:hypothetical protein
MNSTVSSQVLDKENVLPKSQTLHHSQPLQTRAFGTDITNAVIQTLDLDATYANDPQRLGCYAREIFDYLKSNESNKLASYGYLRNQLDINEKMRAILVDWMTEVHLKFKLNPETLFLTVNLLDRYLEKSIVTRNKLQLVGVACMLIASKYEEIYAPEVKDFVYIADKAFSKEEILLMERDILRELDFGLTAPSILRFLERYAHIAQIDTRQFLLGRYLIELTLTEYKMLRYTPSLIAASVVYLTNKIMKRELAWPQIMVEHTRYRDSELKACAKDLCMLLQGAEKCCLQSVRKKFALEAYGEVSKISIGSITSPMRR